MLLENSPSLVAECPRVTSQFMSLIQFPRIAIEKMVGWY